MSRRRCNYRVCTPTAPAPGRNSVRRSQSSRGLLILDEPSAEILFDAAPSSSQSALDQQYLYIDSGKRTRIPIYRFLTCTNGDKSLIFSAKVIHGDQHTGVKVKIGMSIMKGKRVVWSGGNVIPVVVLQLSVFNLLKFHRSKTRKGGSDGATSALTLNYFHTLKKQPNP